MRVRRRLALIVMALITLSGAFALVWQHYGDSTVTAAAAIVTAVLTAVLTVPSFLIIRDASGRQAGRQGNGMDLNLLCTQLGDDVRSQWESEATLRDLIDPQPITVCWSEARSSLMDHPENTSLTGSRPSLTGRVEQVVNQYKSLPKGRLVVIGEPGSGKTVLLLLLTQGLLSERRFGDRVPVLLSLASWDPNKRSFLNWLQGHLWDEYPLLGREGARALVDHGKILPLLDGLDELPGDMAAMALKEINRAGVLQPLVVACRSEEFDQAVRQGDVLRAAAVIELKAVQPEDAREYLRRTTPPDDRLERWEPVFRELRRGAHGPVAEALATPLMLSLARTVYRTDWTRDPAELMTGTRDEIEARLLDAFIPAIFTAGTRQLENDKRRWTPEEAQRWLTFLAQQLHQRDLYDFAWWELPRSGVARRFMVGAIFGIAGALAVALGFSLVPALLPALTSCLLFGAVQKDTRRPTQFVIHLNRRLLEHVALGLGGGLTTFLWWGLPSGFLLASWDKTGVWQRLAVLEPLEVGLAVGLAIGLLVAVTTLAPGSVEPGSSFRIDRKSFIIHVLVLMLITPAAIGTALQLTLQLGLQKALAVGLCVGLIVVPMHAAQFGWPWFQLSRTLLALRGELPWRTMAFLREAHELGVLRQIGSVYQFRHARLQDRLATVEAGRQEAIERTGSRGWANH